MFSNPPIHGARIVAEILDDEELMNIWRSEAKGMAERIMTMSMNLHFKRALIYQGTNFVVTSKMISSRAYLSIISQLLMDSVTMVAYYFSNR